MTQMGAAELLHLVQGSGCKVEAVWRKGDIDGKVLVKEEKR